MEYNRVLLHRELRADEGYRNYPYKCPADHLTIGIGRNLETNGLKDKEIDFLFWNDVADCEKFLDTTHPDWRTHPDPVQRALVNLFFNLGPMGFLRFVNTRDALDKRDYKGVIKGLKNSKWYTQVQPSRSTRILEQFRSALAVFAVIVLFLITTTTAFAGDYSGYGSYGSAERNGTSSGGPSSNDVWSGYVRQPDGTYRWGGRGYSSGSAGDGGCGCSPDRSGGHAEAAGY